MVEWKKLILPGFLALVMILSVFGVIIGGISEDDVEIKEFKGNRYINRGETWSTTVGQNTFIFNYDPEELAGISMPLITFNDLNSAEKIYLTIQPDSDKIGQVAGFINSNLIPQIGPPVITSCIKDHEKCSNLPLKTCSDATQTIKVISIEEGETRISYANNCLEITTDGTSMQKMLEALLFNMYGLNP